MKIQLESYFLQDLMTLLEQQWDQDYRVHQPGMLKISTPDYTSRFRAQDFSQGLGCFYLDMQLEEDLEVNTPAMGCQICELYGRSDFVHFQGAVLVKFF